MLLDQAMAYALADRESAHQPAEQSAPSTASSPLTSREREVARLVARGYTNRQIAEALIISERTAERHVQNMLDKLGFSSRAQLAVWAAEHGLLLVPSD